MLHRPPLQGRLCDLVVFRRVSFALWRLSGLQEREGELYISLLFLLVSQTHEGEGGLTVPHGRINPAREEGVYADGVDAVFAA